jgi:Methyltransferase domain
MTVPTEILRDSTWQMTFGERSALEGLLSQIQPALSIEIGTAEGGSLHRIARHSKVVHSFDLVEPEPEIKALKNVTLHTGDSHVLLKELLEQLAEAGENVDFVLVDGDHSADGAEQDLRDLLASDAIKHSVIILHDTLNDEVREGFERVDLGAIDKVAHSDIDFVGGHLSEGGDFDHQLWGGMGLVLVDEGGEKIAGIGHGKDGTFYDQFQIYSVARESLIETGAEEPSEAPSDSENAHLRAELARAHDELRQVKQSPSWRVTAPLRAAKQAVAEQRRRRSS